MNNMPKTKIGIVAVSRDCFPESLSVTRREALIKAYKEKYDPEDIYECPVCIVESEIHMVQALEDIKKAGADIITVHAEACTHLDRVVNQIKEAGCKVGVALNPATPVSVLECILGQVDMVLIMTVNPGFGGQKFIPYTLEKVKQVRAMCDAKGLNTDIQVDGGVSAANVREVLEAGANVFVAGSAVFGSEPAARVKEFNEIFKEYEK